MKLRGYQIDLKAEVSAAFWAGFRAVCLQLATGGGKTAIAGQITLDLYHAEGDKPGVITLFLVHRKELLEQTYNTLKAFGLEQYVGIIGAGYPQTPWAPLQIASVPTLVRRLNALPWLKPRLVVCDEAHHIRAASWEKVINHFKASYLLGLTATPARLDGRGLGEFFDHLVVGPTISDLVAWGDLAPVDTYSIPIDLNLKEMKRKSGGDWSAATLAKAVPKGPVIASATENFERLARDRRVLHFAYNVDASEEFVSKLRGMGYRAEHVDAQTPELLRTKIFNRFGTGQTQVLSNVMIATEGYDCPECDCVILARPTASTTLYRQMVGRAMRPKHDHRRGLLVDLVGNIDLHGDPDTEIEWTLEDGVVQESQEEAKLAGRTCKSCGFRYPVKLLECPMCGEKYQTKQIEEVDVELVPRGSTREKPRRSTKHTRAMTFKLAAESDGDPAYLRKLAAEAGYKPKIIHIWKRLYGSKWLEKRGQENLFG